MDASPASIVAYGRAAGYVAVAVRRRADTRVSRSAGFGGAQATQTQLGFWGAGAHTRHALAPRVRWREVVANGGRAQVLGALAVEHLLAVVKQVVRRARGQ